MGEVHSEAMRKSAILSDFKLVRWSKGRTYRRRGSFTRGRWWRAARAVIHGRHAGRRRWNTQTGRSTWGAHTRHSCAITGISPIPISTCSAGWRRRSLLVPRSSATSSSTSTRGAVATCMRSVSIIATTALRRPRGCTALIARAIVVARAVVPPSLLPWSHIAGRRSALPWLHVTIIVTVIGTSLDPARRLAVWAWSTTGQFLHKLLYQSAFVGRYLRNHMELTSISRSTASPCPMALRPPP